MENQVKIESQPLVKGCFLPEDASEILYSLFQSKMQFHSVALLSSQERGGKDEFHRNRITELSRSLEYLSGIIKLAKQRQQMVEMECLVNMKLHDNM